MMIICLEVLLRLRHLPSELPAYPSISSDHNRPRTAAIKRLLPSTRIQINLNSLTQIMETLSSQDREHQLDAAGTESNHHFFSISLDENFQSSAVTRHHSESPTSPWSLEDDEEITAWIPSLPAGILRGPVHPTTEDTDLRSSHSNWSLVPHTLLIVRRRPSSNPFRSQSKTEKAAASRHHYLRRYSSSPPTRRSESHSLDSIKDKIKSLSISPTETRTKQILPTLEN